MQVAHFKLSYSRAFTLRAYPQQTHEMLFDAHNHAFRVLGGVPRRGIYGERDNRPIEASPCREPLQPLGAAILVLRPSKHDGASAVNHLTSEIMIGASAYSSEPRFALSLIHI